MKIDILQTLDRFLPRSIRLVLATSVLAAACTRSRSTVTAPSEIAPTGTASPTSQQVFEAADPTSVAQTKVAGTVESVLTATADAQTIGTHAAATLTELAPVPTATGTPTPTSTETPAPDVWDTNRFSIQELPWNNLYQKYSPEQIWVKVMENERAQYPSREALGRRDSFLTNLANAWKPAEFNPDPLLESGLEYDTNDMFPYDINSLLAENKPVNELGNYNKDTGHFTAIVTGQAHDRDAMAVVTAVQILAAERPELFIKQGNFISLKEAINSPELRDLLLNIENQIFGRVQEGFLPITQEELDRRGDPNVLDASALIPEIFQRSNQSVSCDVFRNGGERDKPNQDLRRVEYTVDGEGTFTQAKDTDQEGFFVMYNPETGKWEMDEMTIRRYKGIDPDQIYSASGEERLQCGPGGTVLLTAAPTRRVIIQVSSVPEQTPGVVETQPEVTPPAKTQLPPPSNTPQPPSSPTPSGATPQGAIDTATPGQPSVDNPPTQPPAPADTQAPPVQPATPVPQPTNNPGPQPTAAVPI